MGDSYCDTRAHADLTQMAASSNQFAELNLTSVSRSSSHSDNLPAAQLPPHLLPLQISQTDFNSEEQPRDTHRQGITKYAKHTHRHTGQVSPPPPPTPGPQSGYHHSHLPIAPVEVRFPGAWKRNHRGFWKRVTAHEHAGFSSAHLPPEPRFP